MQLLIRLLFVIFRFWFKYLEVESLEAKWLIRKKNIYLDIKKSIVRK